MKGAAGYLIACLAAAWVGAAAAADTPGPWERMQQRFARRTQPDAVSEPARPSDPWQMLRQVFLPFSEADETRAKTSRRHAAVFSEKFQSALAAHDPIIKRAAREFRIPEAVIAAVIMAESGGNPRAAAGITTAKGLMQTIDSTFAMARDGLRKRGITIADTPYDPEASIMAGAWYLDRMYRWAADDKKIPVPDRSRIATWRYPLEYYYAGPANGAKPANKIIVFSKGKQRIIDKRGYSEKIQTWARILTDANDKGRTGQPAAGAGNPA